MSSKEQVENAMKLTFTGLLDQMVMDGNKKLSYIILK